MNLIRMKNRMMNRMMNFLMGYNFRLNLVKSYAMECNFRSNVMEPVSCCVVVPSKYWSAKAARKVVNKCYSLEPGSFRLIWIEPDDCKLAGCCSCYHYLAEDYYTIGDLPGYCYSGYCPMAEHSGILEMYIPDPNVDDCTQAMCMAECCARS